MHVDLWARMALGALGFAVRAVVFTLARRRWPHAHPITAVLCAELIAQIIVATVTFTLPLPTIERFAQRMPWRLGLDDERIDAIYAWVLLLPLFVVLIYYGYVEHGLPGATGWSLATIAPHYLLRLLNDRRTRLARNATALAPLNVALGRKQPELRDFVYTVTHDLKSPVNAILLTADEALDREREKLTLETARRPGADRAAGGDHRAHHRRLARPLPDHHHGRARQGGVTEGGRRRRRSTAAGTDRREAHPHRGGGAAGRSGTGEQARACDRQPPLERRQVRARSAGVVQVSAEESWDGDVVLCVRDNGVGIEPRYHRTIFDLFTSVPAPGSWWKEKRWRAPVSGSRS